MGGDRAGVRASLIQAIEASALPKYVYGYPSKRAYRSLDSTQTLARLWRGIRGPVNLYVHVPFCAYRCSFCTLFLTTSHDADLRQRYVEALQRQIRLYGRLLPEVKVVSLYIGGGTPSALEADQFEALFTTLREAFPVWHPEAEVSVEGSPDSLTSELLTPLRELGVNRVSMGLQTLDDGERQRVGRPYPLETVYAAVDAINAMRFENVNYDLIYGLEGQTRESWLRSLHATVDFAPGTITLYPVVVRPLTAIEKRQAKHADEFMANESRYALYDESVDYLTERGFRQNSFVRFSTRALDGLQQEVADFSGVPLIGFGAGSRSYTDRVHYGTDFAVRGRRSLEIIADFIAQEARPERIPGLGFLLDEDERKRRFCILNLSLGGLDAGAYRARFGSGIRDDFGEELAALEAEHCISNGTASDAEPEAGCRLTRKGFKYSNVIATLFQSERVTAAEERFVPS